MSGGVARWRQMPEADGWTWSNPHWDQRLAAGSTLALVVEALRRGIDLRDAAAESGENSGLTTRALLLMSVLNSLYERSVAERAEALGRDVPVPHGSGAEIVHQLSEAGLLSPDEYRPV